VVSLPVKVVALLLAFTPCNAQLILRHHGQVASGSSPYSATDNFNRTNENPLGGNWTLGLNGAGGNITLTSNQVSCTGVYNAFAYRNTGTFANNQYSQIKFTATPSSSEVGGPAVRCSAGTNGAYAYIFTVYNSTTGGFYCHYTGDNWVQIGSDVSISVTTGDVLKLTVSGSVLTIYQNGTQRGTATDANNRIASGRAGFNGLNSVTFDDWEGGDL
jgi:hypothetical protein